VNQNKKPSRKHDWTEQEILIAIQCFTLLCQMITFVALVLNLILQLR
jgi:hypothetical protein